MPTGVAIPLQFFLLFFFNIFPHSFFPFLPQAFYILDELLVAGEIQETSKKNIIRAINAQDVLQEVNTHLLDRLDEQINDATYQFM